MSNREETMEKKSFREIEDVIAKAIKKVGGRKENDLCKYLPMSTGGYMHHFTLRKMKLRQPQELSTIIEKFIINNDRPHSVPPKQRAARGSRKRRDRSWSNSAVAPPKRCGTAWADSPPVTTSSLRATWWYS